MDERVKIEINPKNFSWTLLKICVFHEMNCWIKTLPKVSTIQRNLCCSKWVLAEALIGEFIPNFLSSHIAPVIFWPILLNLHILSPFTFVNRDSTLWTFLRESSATLMIWGLKSFYNLQLITKNLN